jgi:calcineurin-like phosphoesterase family protein
VAEARTASSPDIQTMQEDHKLVHYCLQILELTVKKWGGRIHFVLGPHDEQGPATRIELEHIQKKWWWLRDSVIFYDLE